MILTNEASEGSSILWDTSCMQGVYKLLDRSRDRVERHCLREDAMTAAIFLVSINLLLIGSLALRTRS